MSVAATYHKTHKGNDEIQSRKNKISIKQRNLLIMINGAKPIDALNDIAVKMGLSPDDLVRLEEAGFIERDAQAAPASPAAPVNAAPATVETDTPAIRPDEAAKFRIAHKFMNDTVVNSLGLKAFFFTLKLERCATRADLSELLGAYSKVLTKATGPTETEVMVDHARELLE